MCKTYVKFTFELLKYLNLKDKTYSLNEIYNALKLKNINDQNLNTNKLLKLDNEGNTLFGTKGIVRKCVLLSIIEDKFMIKYEKPCYEYFEYYQKPIHIEKIDLIIS